MNKRLWHDAHVSIADSSWQTQSGRNQSGTLAGLPNHAAAAWYLHSDDRYQLPVEAFSPSNFAMAVRSLNLILTLTAGTTNCQKRCQSLLACVSTSKAATDVLNKCSVLAFDVLVSSGLSAHAPACARFPCSALLLPPLAL